MLKNNNKTAIHIVMEAILIKPPTNLICINNWQQFFYAQDLLIISIVKFFD